MEHVPRGAFRTRPDGDRQQHDVGGGEARHRQRAQQPGILLVVVAEAGLARVERAGHVTQHAEPVDQRLRLDHAILIDHRDAAAGEVDAGRLHTGKCAEVGLDVRHGLRPVGLRHEEFDTLQTGAGRGNPACRILAFQSEGLKVFAVEGAAGKGHQGFTTKRKIL